VKVKVSLEKTAVKYLLKKTSIATTKTNHVKWENDEQEINNDRTNVGVSDCEGKTDCPIGGKKWCLTAWA